MDYQQDFPAQVALTQVNQRTHVIWFSDPDFFITITSLLDDVPSRGLCCVKRNLDESQFTFSAVLIRLLY